MKVLYFLKCILFSPLCFIYIASDNKELIIRDLYNGNEPKAGLWRYIDLVKELAENKFFRTLYYFRNPGTFSNFFRLFYPKYQSFFIDIRSQIGGGVTLAHPYCTIVNAQSIGEGLYISHLVTIGEKNGKRPIIGNNVTLHANSMVIGGIKVGDNAIVGAGAVVVKDVPENAVVAGNPSRIIKYGV